jgi:hypothetical protein
MPENASRGCVLGIVESKHRCVLVPFRLTNRVGAPSCLTITSRRRGGPKALVRLAPLERQLTEIPFRDLPLYRPDYETRLPTNSPQMNSPEAYIQFTPGLIDQDGNVTDKSTAEFFRAFMTELHAFAIRACTVCREPPNAT